MDISIKENTLADAIAKIETLQAKNESLEADLITANSKIAELEDELSVEKTAQLPRRKLWRLLKQNTETSTKESL